MSKKLKKILIILCAAFCITSIAACGVTGNQNSAKQDDATTTVTPTETVTGVSKTTVGEPTGAYNEGVVLVKYDGEVNAAALSGVDYQSVEPLYMGSQWYTVTLKDSTKTEETVQYLSECIVYY